MPDDLDLSRPIEAPLPSDPARHLGRFRVDLATRRWTWLGAPPGPVDLLALQDAVGQSLTDAIAAGAAVAATCRTTEADGPRTLLLVAEPEHDAAGRVVSAAGHVVDLGPAGTVPTGAATNGAGPAGAARELSERVEQLETALRTRPVIEQAKGMLMLMHRFPEETAFRLLIGISQAVNRKLRDVAAEIVEALAHDRPLSVSTARALAGELGQLRRRETDEGPPRR